MNRAERRKAAKAVPAYRRGMTGEALIQQMSKNGITVEQYDNAREEEYNKGYMEGLKQGREDAAMQCYAACALAMKQVLRFGKKRILRILRAMDDHVMYSFDGSESIEKVWEDCGIQMVFHNDPLKSRIEEAQK